MPIKGAFPKNVKKLIRTNSLYIEYTFFRPNLQKFGKKVAFFMRILLFVLIMRNKLKN